MATSGTTSVGSISVDIEGNVQPFKQSLEEAKTAAKQSAKEISQTMSNELGHGMKQGAQSAKDTAVFDSLRAELNTLRTAADNLSKGMATGLSQDVKAGANAAAEGLSNAGSAATATASSVRTLINIGMGITGVATAITGTAIAMHALMAEAEKGMPLQKQSEAFANLAAAAGSSSERVLTSLKQMSRGFVDDAEIIRSAGTAMMMGIPANKLADLMKIAEATSRQTGQTVSQAFDNISLGMARQSKRILDNLGIIVSIEKANEEYAKSIHKTAAELTDAEKAQAFMNATIKSGMDLVSRIGDSTGAVDNINKSMASHQNLWNEVSKTIAVIVDRQLPAYVKALDWATQKVKEFREGNIASNKKSEMEEIQTLTQAIIDARVRQIQGIKLPGFSSSDTEEYLRGMEDELQKKQDAWNKKYFILQLQLKPSEEFKKLGSETKPFDVERFRERERNLNWDLTDEEKKVLRKSNEEDRKKLEQERETSAKKSIEVSKEFQKEYEKTIGGAYDFELEKINQNHEEFMKYVKDKVAVQEWYAAKMRQQEVKQFAETAKYHEPGEWSTGSDGEDQFTPVEYVGEGFDDAERGRARSYKKSMENMQKANEDFEKNNEELWKKSLTTGEDTFDAFENMSQRTADAMEQNFSDLFFDAFTGELKNLEDYANAIFRSIQRGFADMCGQMMKESLFGGGANGAPGLFQGVFNSLFGGGDTGMGTNTEFQGGQSMGDYLNMVGDRSNAGWGWGAGSTSDFGFGAGYAAKGAVFGPGRAEFAPGSIRRFASGGIVSKPTTFRFANGIGLMGEAGDEAILPLERTSQGKLGVRASGAGGGDGGSVSIVVNNHTPAPAQVKEGPPASPGEMRQIFVTIGADISRGGPISKSLETSYGLRRLRR